MDHLLSSELMNELNVSDEREEDAGFRSGSAQFKASYQQSFNAQPVVCGMHANFLFSPGRLWG